MDHIAYPMVCFCDIPLSRIHQHVGFYGEYGFGMSMDWAKRNGLNPVVYLSSSSPLTSSLQQALTNLQGNPATGYTTQAEDANNIISYIKPVEGLLPPIGVVPPPPDPKQFYQENEWRYVPHKKGVSPWLSREQYNDSNALEQHNQSTKAKALLAFSPSDIKYIFVRHDSEIPLLFDFINSNMDRFSAADLKILTSRIVSLQSISADL